MVSFYDNANLKLYFPSAKRRVCVSVMDIKKLIKVPGEFDKVDTGKNTGKNDNPTATLTTYYSSMRV